MNQVSEMRGHLLVIISIFALVAGLIIGGLLSYRYAHSAVDDIQRYLKESSVVERSFIEHLPIYEDYISPEKTRKLRAHLQREHMAAAKRLGAGPVRDDAEIETLVAEKKLVSLKSDRTTPYYFYNVRKRYRYLTPLARDGLLRVTARFQKRLKEYQKNAVVKIAVSSAIRPAAFQNRLLGKNRNAVIKSTHSYGTSFDIFFDDYFVALPLPGEGNAVSRRIIPLLRRRLGFLMGDALRRQFRSALSETLIELQDEGELFAILERRQHCFHVTILR